MNLVKKSVPFLLFMTLVQVGCSQALPPSTIIIAVDKLSINDVACNAEMGEKSGLQILCDESARFTHAFTTSILTVPALTSILTGLYPYQIKVHTNAEPPLQPEVTTIAEKLILETGVRTSFFSGGPPVWRKSGLNQGFEVFDDSTQPNIKSIFRPFHSSVDLFKQWLNNDPNSSFFSVFYVPDLNFINNTTVNALGETRNLTYESQLENFDKELYELITYLKKNKLWQNMTFIFVGLNGRSETPRQNEIAPLNLHWENTQVPLLIKPWRTMGELPIRWKIDRNVSLADLGKTLFDLWNFDVSSLATEGHQISLKNLLTGHDKNVEFVRTLPIESGWGKWHGYGNIRYAFIRENYLYLLNKSPVFYNTLTDHLETNPMSLQEKESFFSEIQEDIIKIKASRWNPLPKAVTKKFSIPFMTWMQEESELQLLDELKKLEKIDPHDREITHWTGKVSAEAKDWPTLILTGQTLNHPEMIYVGERNLHFKNVENPAPCIHLLSQKNISEDQIKKCDDVLFIDLISWIRSETLNLKKDFQKAKFIRNYRNYLLDQKIYRFNIALGKIWDISLKKKFQTSLTELILNLPENKRYQNEISKEISLPSETDL